MRPLPFLLLAAGAAVAADPVEVLVLGAYHFANPGRDIHNVKVDDVLAPRRQSELRAVADALARFRPTRVAVESRADAVPGRALASYREYLDGKHEGNRNEIHQIGFRVARQLGHAAVYGIDADGSFPFEAVEKYAEANGRKEQLAAALEALGAGTRAFEARQQTATVGQLLRLLNEPRRIAAEHDFYMGLLRYGAGAEQPGAKLAGDWYARNLAICARLVQIATPGDRILVVYGSGHGYLLRHCAAAMPGWRVVETNAYLPR